MDTIPENEIVYHAHTTHPVRRWMGAILLLFTAGVVIAMVIASPPRSFPVDTIITIESGATTTAIAGDLADRGVIRSPLAMKLWVRLSGDIIHAGDYMFDRPVSLPSVMQRLSTGRYGDVFVRVTIPEGSTRAQIADIVAPLFPQFDKNYFLDATADQEGYLFPDTYFLFPSSDTDLIIETMRNNFTTHIEPFMDEINAGTMSLDNIITMASIVEKEAYGDNDSVIISGILWKRIDIGMALQVDAPFLYLLNKRSDQLTRADLDIDSPYNTYRYPGLPPGPIGSPGERAIDAAVHPQESPYYYYLHDDDGGVHYAASFSEHVQNKNTYLR